MGWKSHLNSGAVYVLALWLGCVLPLCRTRMYTNHWAVRITGASQDADRIADKYGYRNMGQIGDLKDYYHFFHRRTIKRSTLSSRGTHNFISMEPEVHCRTLSDIIIETQKTVFCRFFSGKSRGNHSMAE
ncbi:UNVERIFIED_CONTAM: hypothetical protein FKN15_031153 [Acipenser sinensis]